MAVTLMAPISAGKAHDWPWVPDAGVWQVIGGHLRNWGPTRLTRLTNALVHA
jgi:hypothetical protein